MRPQQLLVDNYKMIRNLAERVLELEQRLVSLGAAVLVQPTQVYVYKYTVFTSKESRVCYLFAF